jgi:hypothetical protein
VVVPIGGAHRAVAQAVEYAKGLSSDVRAVYVGVGPVATDQVRTESVFHNQRALLIKGALLFTRHSVVTSVPFHLSR